MSEERGTGRTSRQILEAPKGATFVWCSENLDYPKELSKILGRDDLRIVGPSWLDNIKFMGKCSVTVDHAAELSPRQSHGLYVHQNSHSR